MAKGWQVSVLIANSSDLEDYIYEGITVYTFQIPSKPNVKELNGLIPPHGINHFISRIKEIKPDIVHFHSFGRAINGFHLKAVKELGIKTAFTPHLGGFFCIKGDVRLNGKQNCDGWIDEKRCMSCLFQSKGKNKFIANLLGFLIQKLNKLTTQHKKLSPVLFQAHHRKNELNRVNKYADLIFAIAPWIQKAFEINGIKKAQLIPQGISPVFFKQNTKQQINKSTNQLHFAFIGRMHPSKGFHLLKKAWENLKGNQARLSIITNPSGGETEYFEKHKAWGQKQDNIIWIESLSQQEVAKYLNKVDVLILPSISNEVSPLVILEAATRKIPVIGSDYIAIKGMIKDGINGLLFKNGDPEQLKFQIQKCIDDKEIITQLSSNIEKPYSMNEVAEIVEQNYGLIIQQND